MTNLFIWAMGLKHLLKLKGISVPECDQDNAAREISFVHEAATEIISMCVIRWLNYNLW